MKNKIKYILAAPLLSTLIVPCCVQVTSCSNDKITPFYKFKITYNPDDTATIDGFQPDCSLERINIPSTFEDEGKTYTVTAISNFAFSLNKKLKQVKIPKTVATIGERAFDSCTSLETFEIESDSNLETFPLGAFSGATSLSSFNFSKCPKLKTITGDFMEGLKSITLPPMLDTINSSLTNPFAKCTKLTNIKISKENQKYKTDNNMLFRKTDSGIELLTAGVGIKNVVVPEGTTIICSNAFSERSLETLKLPASVEMISSNSFELCKNLKTVKIDNNSKLTDIRDYAFRQCISLKSVTMPDDTPLKYIGVEAFYQNVSLQDFNFKIKQLTTIAGGAFDCCTSLKKVELSNDTKIKFYNNVFSNCLNLTSFISRGNMDIQSTTTSLLLDGCINLNEIVISQDISSTYSLFSFSTRCKHGTFITKNASTIKDRLILINQNFETWNFVEYE